MCGHMCLTGMPSGGGCVWSRRHSPSLDHGRDLLIGFRRLTCRPKNYLYSCTFFLGGRTALHSSQRQYPPIKASTASFNRRVFPAASSFSGARPLKNGRRFHLCLKLNTGSPCPHCSCGIERGPGRDRVRRFLVLPRKLERRVSGAIGESALHGLVA